MISKGTHHMSKTLRTITLAAGVTLTLVACTAQNTATGDTQKSQANTLFVNPFGGGGGGGGGSGY
jgi:hypothetical protein